VCRFAMKKYRLFAQAVRGNVQKGVSFFSLGVLAVFACCKNVHVAIAFPKVGESVHTHTVIHSRRGVKHGCEAP
ncbi:MAG: hypothetical protein IKV55_02315, partial [Oscillospiraceae bacterium]|nr:hypothetical protein [Oscillospiraceae bacterium]